MDSTITIEAIPDGGFRATSADPFAVTVDAATRDEALAKVRAEVERRRAECGEALRARIAARTEPLWPDNQFTRDWLAGIAAAREAANSHIYAWEEDSPEAKPS